MGWIALVIALVLFFLAGVGSTVIPSPVTWGLFFMVLGFLVGGYNLPLSRS